MNDLVGFTGGSTPITMTSLELVDFINVHRKEQAVAAGAPFPSKGFAELQHKDFLDKVFVVLGNRSAEFSADLPDSYGRPRTGYSFPKREACLMAMSYSYELQARVFDRMTALEEERNTNRIPQTFAEALRLAADLEEQKALAERQRDLAIATKAEIGSRREATAMNTARHAVRKMERLEVELDRSKSYATIKRMEMLYHGLEFKWRLLKDASVELGIPSIDVFDANYGTVKAYHADVWLEAYAVSIAPEHSTGRFNHDHDGCRTAT